MWMPQYIIIAPGKKHRKTYNELKALHWLNDLLADPEIDPASIAITNARGEVLYSGEGRVWSPVVSK